MRQQIVILMAVMITLIAIVVRLDMLDKRISNLERNFDGAIAAMIKTN